MALLDTHILSWMAVAPRKLSKTARALLDDGEPLHVSALIAFEFDDLVRRGRMPGTPMLEDLIAPFALQILDFPTDCWRIASALPQVHGDPVDRMLIAHAIHADLPIVTADGKIPHYPVRIIW